MQIVDNKALVLRTRKPGKYTVIPYSHIVGEVSPGLYEVAVRWGLDEARVLRNLGVKNVPSPIAARYNWPGRHKPFQHQIETSSFLTLHRRAFVFNEPGTGKTLSALWAADYLMKRGEVRRVLILCPLSIMQSAWMQDIGKSVIHRSAIVAHHAQAARRVEMVRGDYEFVIVNYDGLNLIADAIVEDGRFDLVIVDEANSYKNVATQRWKALNKILKPATFLWMMTGTPAAQSPLDAYGLAKLVNPEAVPRFFTAWRDKVMSKVTTFKWVAKSDAPTLVHEALQPAIRFTKSQCLDLPPVVTVTREVPLTAQQNKYYKLLKERLLVEAAGETITAINAAAGINKLLQISCIAYNTPVLTNNGWVPIQCVRDTDLLWDGEAFVSHDGLLYKGIRRVVACHGVSMTAEHEVLTRSGWRTAEEINDGNARAGLDREPVWLPDGDSALRHERWQNKEGYVAVPLLLWYGSCAREPILTHPAPDGTAPLWMPARQQGAWVFEHAATQDMDRHAQPLRRPERQGLAQLRRAWNTSMQAVARFVRQLLGGHGVDVQAGAYAGPHQQHARLQQSELPVGHTQAASEQHTREPLAEHTERAHDAGGRGEGVRSSISDAVCSAASLRLAAIEGTDNSGAAPVYDIANCGPRNRFVVLGKDGQPLIVHNCGAVYTDTKEVIEFDCSPRLSVLDEVLAETSRKVIVFAPYRHSIDTISAHLTKAGVSNEQIHGDVSAGKRGLVFKRFQEQPDPRVLVIQPQSAAHGVTLTAADTVVFWGPVMSVETYLQCCARADRVGQDSSKVLVVHIQGSEIERKMFTRLSERVEDHDMLVTLYEEVLDTKSNV